MDLQLNLAPPRKKRFAHWLSNRIANRLEHDSYIWRCSSAALLIFSSFISGLAALGMPTGFGAVADIGAFVLASGFVLIFATQAIAILLSLMYLPVPRLFLGFLGYTATLAYFVFFHLSFGVWPSIWMAGAFAIVGAFIGIAAGWIWRYKLKGVKWVAAAAAISAVSAAAILYPLGEGVAEPSSAIQHDADSAAADVSVPAVIGPEHLQLADPSEPGSFQYREFTYGSGDDRQRKSFRSGTELITSSVDASGYITKWPWLKELFWGFDEEKLPVNGTVWMPEGEGEFPLVLIVHGNHLMEDFSDGGYRYLGELLASRGMIAVSVDENFLNYSAWSGIPDQDFKVRAWMLLKHLQQIQTFNEQPDSAFYGKVNLEQVALIGHSRGGQAVAMAADRNQWFAEDKSLDSLDSLHIQSVVALAPTDKEIDDKLAMLQDVNYLTLQGARDADVNSFYGDRQYSRTSFSQETANHFKASLYIAEANHSRFNSDWGTMDESLPGGLLLNQKGMLKAEEQRQIAKVYVSAFLETTLNGQEGYEPLFQDYRSGADWLPASTGYVSRYEDSSFAAAATFPEDSNKAKLPAGGKLETDGMLQMSDSSLMDDGSKGSKGVVIEWEDSGSLTLNLPESYSTAVAEEEQHVLTFSIANLAMELEMESPGEASADSAVDTAAALPPQPNIAIEIVTTDGSTVELPLDQFMEVPNPFDSTYLNIPWLEKRIKDGKYKDSAEPVFQTYRLPLAHFAEEAGVPLSDLQVSEISFRVEEGPGKVVLGDIGFSQ
ncbi:alpha/beta hydrolase [Paenibacillus sp. NPDC058174]|uniref:poly(ethylene terephthalate) hydrolase family protein n=1 Tax=Paenibacillus sp. NPDC058174 TaxID=3346366 RepID=UPI0036DC8903